MFAMFTAIGIALVAVEGELDVVGIRGLRQVMARAELHRLDGGGDAGKTRQDHDAHIGVVRMQALDAIEAGPADELQVDDREIGRCPGQKLLHGIIIGNMRHLVFPPLERAFERLCQRHVILDDE